MKKDNSTVVTLERAAKGSGAGAGRCRETALIKAWHCPSLALLQALWHTDLTGCQNSEVPLVRQRPTLQSACSHLFLLSAEIPREVPALLGPQSLQAVAWMGGGAAACLFKYYSC